MMRPLPEGGTEGDALKSYKRRFGKDHPEARCPVACPSEIAYLWAWFWQLAAGRAIGPMGGLLPVPPSEILAWATLRKIEPEPWELDALHALDTAFIRMAMKKG